MANSLIWDTPILAITSSPLIKRIASSQGWSLYPAVLHSFFYDRPCVLVNRNAILFFQLTGGFESLRERASGLGLCFVGLHYPRGPGV